jgi:hypothetical protein
VKTRNSWQVIKEFNGSIIETGKYSFIVSPEQVLAQNGLTDMCLSEHLEVLYVDPYELKSCYLSNTFNRDQYPECSNEVKKQFEEVR